MRRSAELDAAFAGALGQVFARAQVERNVGPAPVVNEQAHGDVGLHGGIGFDLGFVPVGGPGLAVDFTRGVLAADDIGVGLAGADQPAGAGQFDFLFAD